MQGAAGLGAAWRGCARRGGAKARDYRLRSVALTLKKGKKMAVITLKLQGKSPLLLQSDTLVDPLNPLTKEHKALTSKRKKTDEDYEAIALSEMRSYLYWKEKLGIYIPAANFEASLRDGAKLNKLGMHVRRSVIVMDDAPIKYKGPKTVDALIRDKGFQFAKTVVVQRARLMRYRPIFNDWSCEFTVSFDESILDRNEILNIADNAGKFAGLGTWRPRFGRYSVEVVDG